MPHIHEKIDFAVTPIIVNPRRDKVLLVNHPKYGRWVPIGGHIELDEHPDQALRREIAEECGLEVEVMGEKPDVATEEYEVLTRPRFIDLHDDNPPHRHIELVYFCVAANESFKLSAEHTEMDWFDRKKLEMKKDQISGLTYYYAKVALKELSSER